MNPTIRIVNWGRFQHYKNRNPPWIKMHRSLLDNREWHALSGDASKLLSECWLLASEYDDGVIPMNATDLAWRLRRPDPAQVARLLQELEVRGFIECAEQHDSSVLSPCLQDATPETEAERETEKEEEITEPLPDGSAADAADEVVEAEVIPDEEWIEPAADEPRPSNVLALRSPDAVLPFGDRMDADEPVNGGQVMAAWIQWKRPSLTPHDRGRQASAAKRLAEGRTMGQVRLAMVGMDCIWPYAPPSVARNSEGRYWDLLNLEKDFNRALAGAANHPTIRQAREDAEWDAAFFTEGAA